MTDAAMTCNKRRVARNFPGWPHGWVGCAMLLGLTACAQLPQTAAEKKEALLLVYPLPPDEPRFIYERTIRSNQDVDKSEIAASTFKDLLTGEKSQGARLIPFRKPYAVAVHRGRIFVSEPSARVVRGFDVPEGRYFEIGLEDPGSLQMPIGIDVDGAGNLYVADATAKAVMVYDRDGKFLRKLAGAKIGEPPLFSRLASVTVDKKGEKIYAVDIGGSRAAVETHRVRVFDARSGAHLFDIGKRGSGPGELNLPRDVAIGKDGNLYVVDSGNFRIQVFDAEGKYLRAFGEIGQQLGNFGRPKEAATDAAGNLYVIDTVFANFQIFNAEGELLMFIGSGSNEDVPARYQLPSGITVDEDGRIYVVDQMFRKVDIFRPAALAAQDGYLGKKLKKGEKSGDTIPGVMTTDEKTVDEMILDGKMPENKEP